MKLRSPGDNLWLLASLGAMKGVIVATVFSLAAQALMAQSATHVRRGVVSDWTQHHVLFPDSKDESVVARLRKDPRWEQSWYLRHRDAWWPQYHLELNSPGEDSQGKWVREHRHEPRPQGAESRRDWSVPLGTAVFSPTINFSFTITPETAFGSVNVTYEGGGAWLATAGSLTVTGGSDVGTWTLIPGGPGVTYSPFGSFIYDNVITPSADPALDVDGLLFGTTGKELNVWGNGVDNYSFYDSTGPGAYGTTLTATGSFSFQPAPGGADLSRQV